MYCFRRIFVLSLAILVGFAALPAGADEAAEAGRAILETHQHAVVTVRLVIKQQFSMMGNSQEEESQDEATGTVIDPSGLTVMSLTATDPMSLLNNMMGGMEEESGFKMESRVSDIKLLMHDGKEIPAKVVLRDKDLDLAFVRPTEEQEAPFECVDLSDAAEPQLLDQLIALNRLGKVAGRSYGASVERVESIVSRPRTFYVPGQGDTTSALGSPVFTLDGKVVGVALMRTIKTTGGSGMMGMLGMMGGGGGGMTAIVLPAGDIREAAQQAPAADEVVEEEPVAEEAPAEEEEDASEG